MSTDHLQANHDEGHRLENGHASSGEVREKDEKTKFTWRQWIVERFNWSFFTCTQSTGGIAIVLSECPKQFPGLQTIGIVVFIFNLVLFLIFATLMILRWITKPSKFRECFTQPPECFFYGSFWLTTATIIISMNRFGVPRAGPWLVVAIRVCFWIYAACTILSTSIHIVVVYKHTPIQSIQMSPAWFLLIFQAMLTGTVASAIAMDQPPAQRLPIIVAGVAYQGLGWLGSLLILTWFFGMLMEKGWPAPSQAPGMFMPIGSAGFTIVALIGAARSAPTGYGYFATHPTAPEILLVVATWVGVFLWVFGLWLFGVALFITLGSVMTKEDGVMKFPMTFKNTWWGE